MENIEIFDIVVVTLITLLGLKGLFRGFTKEFFALAGIIGGVFIASRIATDTGNLINGIIPMSNENTIMLAGFVASFALIWIAAYILGNIVAKVFDASGLGVIDRLLGFTFGAGKIFLIFSIIAYAVTQVKTINDNLQPKLKNSIVFPILKDTGGYLIKLDTSGFQQEVSNGLDKAVESTKRTLQEVTQEEIKEKASELKKQLEETTSDN